MGPPAARARCNAWLLLPLVVLSSVAEGGRLRRLPTRAANILNATSALGLVNVTAAHNATQERFPFSARVDPAVGKVFSLYYSSYSDAKATSVEAGEEYLPATRTGVVWDGAVMLREPGCPLQLRSTTNYPTDRRKANLRLAELAVCQLLEQRMQSLPGCHGNAAGNNSESGSATTAAVCELSVFVPMPSSDELQEPYIAAAMALAAYSRICALSQSSAYESYKCEVQRSMSAVCAGLELSGKDVQLRGLLLPGLLDLKLEDAYVLNLERVYLAEESRSPLEETEFYHDQGDVLKWKHAPPQVRFCANLACLVADYIPGAQR